MTDTGTPPEGNTGTPDQSKTFTQAEVDAIVLKRAERVAADKYGDYADLKTKAQRLEEIETANASELEKAIKKARDEGRTEVQTAANARLVAAEARAIAAEAKFRNPKLAVKAVDLSAIKVSDDGSIDSEAIKAMLSDLATSEPYLVDDGKVTPPRPDRTQGGTAGDGGSRKGEQGLLEAQKRFGAPAGQKQ